MHDDASRDAQPLYPGYDVLSKRDTPSWNAKTRAVIDARLAIGPGPAFFDAARWATLVALCARIVPQTGARPPVPLPALVEARIHRGHGDGYRDARLPPIEAAWTRGLDALEHEARTRHGRGFAELDDAQRDELIKAMQQGALSGHAWAGMPSDVFFADRVLHDVCGAYYTHPASWSEIGFGGPASPRGYVRMYYNRRDPWEAAEATPGNEARARKENERVG